MYLQARHHCQQAGTGGGGDVDPVRCVLDWLAGIASLHSTHRTGCTGVPTQHAGADVSRATAVSILAEVATNLSQALSTTVVTLHQGQP